MRSTLEHCTTGNSYTFVSGRTLTTARAVPLAELPDGVVLVLRLADAADALPEALALALPDAKVVLYRKSRAGGCERDNLWTCAPRPSSRGLQSPS